MDFSHSDKVRRPPGAARQFMEAHVYPAEPAFTKRWRKTAAPAIPGRSTEVMEELKRKAQGGESLEPVPAALRARRRSHQPRIRAVVRDHGTLAYRAGGVQLLGAGYGQHGSAGPLRHAGAAAALARAVARRPDPLGIRDDRTGRGIERCHQHSIRHRARRRSLRDQRRASGGLPAPAIRAARY